MIKKKHLEDARKIYNPKHEQVTWVGKIVSLLERKGMLGVSFARPFKVGDLVCVGIELEDTPTCCLVKWRPNFEISTQTEPCCSAFILTCRELKIIYDNIITLLY